MPDPDPPLGSKLDPAPLDAFETAAPDEPIWTVQGGDPLSSALLSLWAHAARLRTGRISGDMDWIVPLLTAARNSDVSHDEREIEDLLIRATQTEQIAWRMDEYRKGQIAAEEPKAAGEKSLTELERLDIYDIRRRAAAKVSQFFSELADIRDLLRNRRFTIHEDELDNMLTGAIASLQTIHRHIEIRRGNLPR